MGCSLPGSSVHGIFQARILEWVAISFSFHQKRWKSPAPFQQKLDQQLSVKDFRRGNQAFDAGHGACDQVDEGREGFPLLFHNKGIPVRLCGNYLTSEEYPWARLIKVHCSSTDKGWS